MYTSKTIVEAKAYRIPVDKDRVMKLMAIVEDVGADRGLIITVSRFAPGARSFAAGRNIDLWDQTRLTELMGEEEFRRLEGQLKIAFRLK